MACFLVPAAEAVVTTVATRALSRREAAEAPTAGADAAETASDAARIPMSRKLRWLSNLLWGGSALLAFEHLWHGEIILSFPFLTAASDPASLAEMLAEMATVGVTMALVATAAWIVMVLVADHLVARAAAPAAEAAASLERA